MRPAMRAGDRGSSCSLRPTQGRLAPLCGPCRNDSFRGRPWEIVVATCERLQRVACCRSVAARNATLEATRRPTPFPAIPNDGSGWLLDLGSLSFQWDFDNTADMRGRLLRIGIAAAGAVVTACTPLSPPTPPLLRDATAGGGWSSGGCPPHLGDEAMAAGPEARSPEVEDRLSHQFPPGTPATALVASLVDQGFRPEAPCDNDPSIRRALFDQRGGTFLGPAPAWARVAWKVDDQGRVVWTKADVAYTGP